MTQAVHQSVGLVAVEEMNVFEGGAQLSEHEFLGGEGGGCQVLAHAGGVAAKRVQLVQGDRHGLREVERWIAIISRDVDEVMTAADLGVRKTCGFGAEDEGGRLLAGNRLGDLGKYLARGAGRLPAK